MVNPETDKRFNAKPQFENGLKFQKLLDNNIKKGILSRLALNKACCICIDGQMGEGKTTLGVLIAKRIEELMGGTFDMNNQIGMGGEQFMKRLLWASENDKHVVVYDEAGDFNTRATMTNFNRDLNTIFETYRAFKVVVILCLPSFRTLDRSLLDKGVIRWLLHCTERTNNWGKYYAYDGDTAVYLKWKLGKLEKPHTAYKLVIPNFIELFKNLDPEESAELDRLSLESKKGQIQKILQDKSELITNKEIMEETGYSLDSIRHRLKEMNAEKKVIGGKNYYSRSVLEHFTDPYYKPN